MTIALTPEMLAARDFLADVTERADSLGIGMAKYPTAEIKLALKAFDAVTTQPQEPVEILARALCQIDGRQPDEIAPRQLVCGPYGEVLPNWEAYREKAEAVLAGRGEVTDEMVERAREAFDDAWDRQANNIGIDFPLCLRAALSAALSTKKDA